MNGEFVSDGVIEAILLEGGHYPLDLAKTLGVTPKRVSDVHDRLRAEGKLAKRGFGLPKVPVPAPPPPPLPPPAPAPASDQVEVRKLHDSYFRRKAVDEEREPEAPVSEALARRRKARWAVEEILEQRRLRAEFGE